MSIASFLRGLLHSADAKAARALDAFHAPQGKTLRALPAKAVPVQALAAVRARAAVRRPPPAPPALVNLRAQSAAAGPSGGLPLNALADDAPAFPVVGPAADVDDLAAPQPPPPPVTMPPPAPPPPIWTPATTTTRIPLASLTLEQRANVHEVTFVDGVPMAVFRTGDFYVP